MNSKTIRAMQRGIVAVVAMATCLASVAQATVFTFQEGVNGYTGTADTFIAGAGAQAINIGAAATMSVLERETSITNFARILIRFDISSITQGTVTNATLTLTQTYSGGNANILNSLYLIKAADAAWTELQATWDNLNQSTTTPWAGGPGLASGTDYDATPIATANSPGSGAMTFTLNAAGLAAVNDWIANPSVNYGFFIRQADGTFASDQFHSSEAIGDTLHPLLTLDVIPEPSTMMLLGAGGLLLWRRMRKSHQ